MADIPTLEPVPGDAASAGATAARKRPWLLITVAVTTVLAGAAGVGGWLMLGHSKPKTGDKAKAETAPSGPALYIGTGSAVRRQLRGGPAGALPADHGAAHVARPGDRRAREGQRSGDPQ